GGTRTAALRTKSRMCRLSWFLDPGGWSKATAVGLYFIFPGICTLSLGILQAQHKGLCRNAPHWPLARTMIATPLELPKLDWILHHVDWPWRLQLTRTDPEPSSSKCEHSMTVIQGRKFRSLSKCSVSLDCHLLLPQFYGFCPSCQIPSMTHCQGDNVPKELLHYGEANVTEGNRVIDEVRLVQPVPEGSLDTCEGMGKYVPNMTLGKEGNPNPLTEQYDIVHQTVKLMCTLISTSASSNFSQGNMLYKTFVP
ncbi:hypothetical protein STEG23_007739, partial [Scotinomys teguina]